MKKILLACVAAIAALALSSCDKQETTVDDQLKSVTISITNVKTSTKSMSAPIADATQVALSNFQVFFTDGTYLYTGKTADNQNATHFYENTAGLQATVFHFLPGSVNKVVVIGNLEAAVTVTDGVTTLASLKNGADGNAVTLAIGDQQDASSLYLYGESGLTATTRTDDEGHPLYEAAVTIYPRVSRFEINSISYNQVDANTPRKYTSIEVYQIGFNNYYGAADQFTGEVSGTVTNTEITASNVFTYFSGLLNGGNTVPAGAWYTDLPAAVLNADGNYAVSYTTACPSYHFFPLLPLATDGRLSAIPQLVLYLLATSTADDGTTSTTPLYLVTSDFVITNEDGTTSSAITQDFAKIYKMQFGFDDNDLENPAKCVELTVSVASWDVVDVTPVF